MVGDSSSDAFTHGELLAERLAGCAVLGTAAPPVHFNSSPVSISVAKSRMGIFKCTVMSTIEIQ